MKWIAGALALLTACDPVPKLPVTGDINLLYQRASNGDVHFQLRNQSAKDITFRGVRTKPGEANPWDLVWECKETVNEDGWMPGAFALRDGDFEIIKILSGEQVDLFVGFGFPAFQQQSYKEGLCRLDLYLLDPRTTIYSDAFPYPRS